AVPGANGSYQRADWSPTGSWVWQSALGGKPTIPINYHVVHGKLTYVGREITVPEWWLAARQGITSWPRRTSGNLILVLKNVWKEVATLQSIPEGSSLAHFEERRRAYEANPDTYGQIYQQTGSDEFAYPNPPAGWCEFGDAAEDEVQGCAWQFDGFSR